MEVGWDEGRAARDELFLAFGKRNLLFSAGTTDGSSARTSDEHFLRREALGKGSDGAPKERSRLRLALPSVGSSRLFPARRFERGERRALRRRRASKELGEGGGNRAVQSSWCTNVRARRRLFSSGSSTASETSRPRARMYFLIRFDRSKRNGGETKTLAFGRYGRGRFRYSSHVTTRIVVVTADARVRPSPLSATRFSSHGGDAAVEDVDHRLLFPGHLRAHGRDRTLGLAHHLRLSRGRITALLREREWGGRRACVRLRERIGRIRAPQMISLGHTPDLRGEERVGSGAHLREHLLVGGLSLGAVRRDLRVGLLLRLSHPRRFLCARCSEGRAEM